MLLRHSVSKKHGQLSVDQAPILPSDKKLMDAGAVLNRRIVNENAAIANANFQNVLAKDNEDPYTPQGPYQPATLQMLQEAIFNSGGGDMHTLYYDPTNQRRDVYAQATETQRGMASIATDAEAMAGADGQKIMTPRTARIVMNPVLGSYFVNPYLHSETFVFDEKTNAIYVHYSAGTLLAPPTVTYNGTNITMATTGGSGTQIRYTVDGSDPRNGVNVLTYSSALSTASWEKGFYRIRAYCVKTDAIDSTVTDMRITVS